MTTYQWIINQLWVCWQTKLIAYTIFSLVNVKYFRSPTMLLYIIKFINNKRVLVRNGNDFFFKTWNIEVKIWKQKTYEMIMIVWILIPIYCLNPWINQLKKMESNYALFFVDYFLVQQIMQVYTIQTLLNYTIYIQKLKIFPIIKQNLTPINVHQFFSKNSTPSGSLRDSGFWQ